MFLYIGSFQLSIQWRGACNGTFQPINLAFTQGRVMKRSEIVPWLLGRLRARSWLLFVSLCAALIGGLIPTIDPLLMRHWIDVTLPPHQLLSTIVIGKVLLTSLMMTLLIAL